MIPRLVAFDKNDIAIAQGCPATVVDCAKRRVVMLPSEHYDFIDCNVVGMSWPEIQEIWVQ